MASAVPPQLVRLVPAQSARPAALPPAFVRAATAPPVQMSLHEEVASAAPHMCRARADWAVSLLVRSGITSLAILARVPWSEIRGFDRADPEQVRAMQTLMRAAASASLGATNSRRTAGNPPGVGALAGTAVSARRQASREPQRCTDRGNRFQEGLGGSWRNSCFFEFLGASLRCLVWFLACCEMLPERFGRSQ